jgi:hypothetical protein
MRNIYRVKPGQHNSYWHACRDQSKSGEEAVNNKASADRKLNKTNERSLPLAILALSTLANMVFCPPPLIAASATTMLIQDLEKNWFDDKRLLDASCKMGGDMNKNALSFFNPYLSRTRVKAFAQDKGPMHSYMNKDELQDKDSISAFADAKEAALLRAMRKRCPNVW